MPNYDYECQKCGERFEVFQSMNDAKLTDCPSETCDGQVKRLLGTGGGIIFKGSGFYETDFKERKGKPATDSGSGDKGEKKEAATGSSEKSAKAESSSSSASTKSEAGS